MGTNGLCRAIWGPCPNSGEPIGKDNGQSDENWVYTGVYRDKNLKAQGT